MDDFKDERFKGIIKDPRFKKIPSKLTSNKFDKRIHGMFSDKRFNLGCKVDKRGMLLDCKSGVKAKKDLSDDEHKKDMDEESDDDDAEDVKDGSLIGVKAKHDLSDDDEHKKDVAEESDDSSEDVKSGSFIKQFPQIDGSDEDGSTSTDTETSDNEQEDEVDHHWQELDADAQRSENITRRLAVCNMDWDRLRADDFLVVFNSFKPQHGVIDSIKIYPSEFGLDRMEKEKLYGPAELIKNNLDSSKDQARNVPQDSEFHQEKLRQYQINRLKYFFAVVDCDTPQTADALYVELNGMEFESSGCILDLRFIPDDMTFTQEPVSVATSISNPEVYKPTSFVTSALNQIKVDLTWDETDPRRKEVLEKAFTDPESIEKDLKEYLASPSESEEELEESSNTKKLGCKEAADKYRALLNAFEEKEKGQENEEFDMEITWDSGLKEKAEELVKEKTLKETLTPFEEKLQKRKELKKIKKERKETLENENDDMTSNEEHDSKDIIDDERQKKVKGESTGPKKNKVKSETNCEADEKKLAELAILAAEPDDKDSSDSDDMNNQRKKRMKKRKKKKDNGKKEDSSEAFVHDPRFSAMYTSHLYHVDPAEQKFKQKKEIQAFINETQRKKYGDSESPVIPCEISKKEMSSVIEGSKGKGKKSTKVEALKEKLTPFCRDFQKKKELRKLQRQEDQSLQKEEDSSVTSENLPVSLSDASISKKNRKKQKAKKRKFHEIKQEDEMSTSSKKVLNISASSDLEVNDDLDILIFSGGSAKKQITTCSAESPHSTNSVRKKLKKNRVS